MRTPFIVKRESFPIIASENGRHIPTREERRQIAEELRRKYSGQLANAPRWRVILIEFKIVLDAWCLDLHRLYRSKNETGQSSGRRRIR